MKETNKSIIIDGLTEVDDLTLVSHFAQTESNRIQEINNFKRAHSDQHIPLRLDSKETKLSHFSNELDDSDGTDTDEEGFNYVLSQKNTYPSSRVYSDNKDPFDDLRIIDTLDLPEKVSDELPILKIGKCKSIFEGILIVESSKDSKVLDLGSIVCKVDRTILGTVNDTFGQTSCPYYMVILKSKDLRVENEEWVYCDVNHSTYVTDQNVYSSPMNKDEDSDDEKPDEPEIKTQNKLRQSYKDL